MRRIAPVIIAFVLAIVVTGCATLPMDSNLEQSVSMTKVNDAPVKSFAVSNKAIWLFWGAIPLALPEFDGIIVPEMAGHAGVQNLKITTKSDFLDLIATVLTDGILVMRTVTVEGEVYD